MWVSTLKCIRSSRRLEKRCSRRFDQVATNQPSQTFFHINTTQHHNTTPHHTPPPQHHTTHHQHHHTTPHTTPHTTTTQSHNESSHTATTQLMLSHPINPLSIHHPHTPYQPTLLTYIEQKPIGRPKLRLRRLFKQSMEVTSLNPSPHPGPYPAPTLTLTSSCYQWR